MYEIRDKRHIFQERFLSQALSWLNRGSSTAVKSFVNPQLCIHHVFNIISGNHHWEYIIWGWMNVMLFSERIIKIVSERSTCKMHGIFIISAWTLAYCNISRDTPDTYFTYKGQRKVNHVQQITWNQVMLIWPLIPWVFHSSSLELEIFAFFERTIWEVTYFGETLSS